MALFTDGPIAAMDDLTGHDSALLAVASTEGIDLSKKLNLAMEDLALELNGLAPSIDRLERIAVTPAIKMWHAYRTLELVYRDAYQNRLNDRYAGKRDQFAALGRRAVEQLRETGIGLINNPLPKASAADLTYFPGEQPGAAYYVCISWTGRQGEEGAVGEWRAITTPDGSVLSVRAIDPPANAGGWNVFVGLTPDTIGQQNSAPLNLDQPWLQQRPVSNSGRAPHNGQAADYLRPMLRTLQRG
jgi:hypothetical protein